DLPEAERLQRLVLLAAGTRGRLDLSDREGGHHALTSGSSAFGSSPLTSRTARPRSSARCAGLRRPWSAATVAFTRLIGFWLPSDFESTSWMPASSSTARTPPPAITPVPGEAGIGEM